jgi:anaerobic magnesium-protoporphyrin IX monomethyl ester cyclase
MKKSVCLVSLPSPFLLDEKVFPPLGLAYVASGLKENGYRNIKIHDESIDSIPKGFDVYAIGSTTPQFDQAKEALRKIREDDKLAKVYIGGPHATVDPELCIESGFSGAILNAGERGLPLAIENDCQIIDAPLKKILPPSRELLNIKKYQYYIDGELATSIMTTRGCPYKCGFCCKINKRVNIFPAEFVNDEIDLLHVYYGYKALMFFDDIFILDKERALKIMSRLKKYSIRWRCFVRADVSLKHGLNFAIQMKESGCREVGIGIESASNEILKTVNKGETIETIRESVLMLKKAGLRVKGFFIIGLPGESWETIEQTRTFIKESGLDDIDLSIFQPLKKSPIYENKRMYGNIDWDEIDLKNAWYKGTPGKYESNVWTPFLTRKDIVQAREMLECELK